MASVSSHCPKPNERTGSASGWPGVPEFRDLLRAYFTLTCQVWSVTTVEATSTATGGCRIQESLDCIDA